MRSDTRPQYSRRDLLKVAGVTLSVPLFLKNAFATPAVTAPPNLVMLMWTNGVNVANYWPAPGAFDSPILHNLLADPIVGPKSILISGVNFHAIRSPSGNGHDWGFHGLYSGYDSISGPGGSFGGGPSLDQVLVHDPRVNFGNKIKNIHCGVEAVNYQAINAGRISFSCAGPGVQLPCQLDLYALYNSVFATAAAPGQTSAQVALRIKQRKSVLDAVANDLVTLENRLGPNERSKVDLHLSSLRDFESRLAAAGLPTTAMCSSAQPSQTGVPTAGEGNEANAETLERLFMEFIANTTGCNMVGVLSFQFGRGGDHFHYGWLNIPGMPADFHNLVAHVDSGGTSPGAVTAGRIHTEVNKWYTSMVTLLAQKIAAFPAGNGKTALDNSLIVWGNEIATGPHGMNGMPIVLVGGAAGRLTRTGYVVSAGPQPHQRLGTSILNIMGSPATGFGGFPGCGTLQGLDVAM
jgi:hypothetical protein